MRAGRTRGGQALAPADGPLAVTRIDPGDVPDRNLTEFLPSQAHRANRVANGDTRQSARAGGGSGAGLMHGIGTCRWRANRSSENAVAPWRIV